MKKTSKLCLASEIAWYCIRGLRPISPRTTTHTLFLPDISLRYAKKPIITSNTITQNIAEDKYEAYSDNFALLFE